LKIPTDYEAMFRDRLLIITGIGRSGTTILGKLIGSMSPVYYLFEPAIFKYHNEPDRDVLFEDYFLPLVQGRNLNPNKKDDSWWGHYYTHEDIKWAHKNLSSRKDAIAYVREVRPLFVVKSNDRINYPPNATVLHIAREALSVVRSMVKKGWYTDEYMQSVVDYVVDGIPHFIDPKDAKLWPSLTQDGRCRCVWKTLMVKNNILTGQPIYYENLCANPQLVADGISNRFGLKQTKLTKKHIRAIERHN